MTLPAGGGVALGWCLFPWSWLFMRSLVGCSMTIEPLQPFFKGLDTNGLSRATGRLNEPESWNTHHQSPLTCPASSHTTSALRPRKAWFGSSRASTTADAGITTGGDGQRECNCGRTQFARSKRVTVGGWVLACFCEWFDGDFVA